MKEENNQISTKYKYADEFNQKTVYKKIININTIDRTLNHTIEEFKSNLAQGYGKPFKNLKSFEELKKGFMKK